MAACVRAEAGEDNFILYLVYFVLLSGRSVSGLEGQLVFCTGQGFFEFGFFVFVWCCLSFQMDQSCDLAPVCDLRAAVLARWLDTEDVEQHLGEGNAFA